MRELFVDPRSIFFKYRNENLSFKNKNYVVTIELTVVEEMKYLNLY